MTVDNYVDARKSNSLQRLEKRGRLIKVELIHAVNVCHLSNYWAKKK